MKKVIATMLAVAACTASAVVVVPHISVPAARMSPPARVYVPSTPIKAPTPAMPVPSIPPKSVGLGRTAMNPLTIPPIGWPYHLLLQSKCDPHKDNGCK